MNTQRPDGVTVLAILCALAAVMWLLGGIVTVLGIGFIGRLVEQQNQYFAATGQTQMARWGMLRVVIVFALAFLFAALAYGMWRVRKWARVLTVVLCILGMLGAMATLVWGFRDSNIFTVFASGIRLGINLLIFWYLSQPHVKYAFY